MPGANSSVLCDYCRGTNQYTKAAAETVQDCTCGPERSCNDPSCLWFVPKRRRGRRRQWYVRSAGRVDYKVGVWVDGRWRPGSLADAFRELDLLDEKDALVVDASGVQMRREDLERWD